ncbi:MAG: amidohydrolase [Saprospiraceae bacterium]|nr:amidohydrolase [Saprospiraceae bacterium]
MKPAKINSLINFRQNLHQHPELSGCEKATAQKVKDFILDFNPDEIIENLGGHGIAFIYKGKTEGKTIMFRCELDAIQVAEESMVSYKSINHGVSHTCGHDGHMTIMAGVAKHLFENKLEKGRVILLFQPAEENGSGAKEVFEDPKFKEIEPDYIFALHNLPGFEKNQIIIKEQEFASSSIGMKVILKGKSSHAAEPENGISPTFALALIIYELKHFSKEFDFFSLITIIYAHLGEKKFGVNPSELELGATFRAYNNDNLDELCFLASESIKEIAVAENLSCDISWHEEFPDTINNSYCVDIIKKATKENNFIVNTLTKPFRWSEDFGIFTQNYPGAMFGLGSGTNHPQLHNPDYDFPDEIIETGIEMFVSIVRLLDC